jgi:hypothetical protein
MKRLRKRPTNNRFFGRGFKYFDPDSNEVLFHLVYGGPSIYEKGDGYRPLYPGIRLYVDNDLYRDLENYLGNFEDDLLKWFNETYRHLGFKISEPHQDEEDLKFYLENYKKSN